MKKNATYGENCQFKIIATSQLILIGVRLGVVTSLKMHSHGVNKFISSVTILINQESVIVSVIYA